VQLKNGYYLIWVGQRGRTGVRAVVYHFQ